MLLWRLTRLTRTKSSGVPSEEEDAIINAQIAADPDDFEWTEEHSFNSVTHPELLALHPEHANDPLFSHTKPAKSISVGIDPDIAKYFYKERRPLEETPEPVPPHAVFGNGDAGE